LPSSTKGGIENYGKSDEKRKEHKSGEKKKR